MSYFMEYLGILAMCMPSMDINHCDITCLHSLGTHRAPKHKGLEPTAPLASTP